MFDLTFFFMFVLTFLRVRPDIHNLCSLTLMFDLTFMFMFDWTFFFYVP